MSLRPVKDIIQTKPTIEGAGVKLQRAFGFGKTKEFDPFLLFDDFRNDNPERLSRRFPMASPSWNRNHHVCARWFSRARGQPGQQRQNDCRRRAVDDGRQRHSAPGNARRRRAGPNARFPTMGQPSGLPQDDRAAVSGYSGRAPFPEITDDDGTRVRVITGEFWGKRGPVEGVAADPSYLDISVPAGRRKRLKVEVTRNAFAYVFAGSGTFRDASDPRAGTH